MYERKTRTEYISMDWDSHEALVWQLNKFINEGWFVEAHRISSDSTSGWTVYMRYKALNEPLLERSINVGEVYSILNSVLEPGSEQARQFDLAIKKKVKQELDDF